MTQMRGSCLCGQVHYTITGEPQLAAHCHCVDCRKSSGTGHCTHVVVTEDQFEVQGEATFYERPADSGNIVSRGFCGSCGSAVYSTNSGLPGMVFPRASSLDDPDLINPQMTVYASRAPSWDRVAGDLPAFDTIPEGGPKQVIADATER